MKVAYKICAVFLAVIFALVLISYKSYFPYSHGEWTPTITNGANVSTSTPHSGNYVRIGNKVMFSGQIDVTPTLAATATDFEISLPIASNFTSIYDANGVNSGSTGAVAADATDDRLSAGFVSEIAGTQSINISGIYWIK